MVLLRLKKGIWLGLEDEITEETILGHRKGEGKKVEEHSDFGHSRESIRHTLHRVVPSGVRSGSSPSEMRLAPPSHSRLLTCSASPSSSFSSSSSISAASSLRVTHGLQLLGQDGQELFQHQQLQDPLLAAHLGPQTLTAKLAEPAQGPEKLLQWRPEAILQACLQ